MRISYWISTCSLPILMHFTVLPAALVMTVATADKINTGVRGLWLRSLPGMALAIVLCGLLTGFALEPETSLPVLLACLPIMLINTLGVSQLGRRSCRQTSGTNVYISVVPSYLKKQTKILHTI